MGHASGHARIPCPVTQQTGNHLFPLSDWSRGKYAVLHLSQQQRRRRGTKKRWTRRRQTQGRRTQARGTRMMLGATVRRIQRFSFQIRWRHDLMLECFLLLKQFMSSKHPSKNQIAYWILSKKHSPCKFISFCTGWFFPLFCPLTSVLSFPSGCFVLFSFSAICICLHCYHHYHRCLPHHHHQINKERDPNCCCAILIFMVQLVMRRTYGPTIWAWLN